MPKQKDHRHKVEHFIAQNGRRPRVLVANTRQSTQIGRRYATVLADLGCDVDLSASDVEPAFIVRQALENDVHLIFIAFHGADAAEKVIDKLLSTRSSEGIEDIPVMVIAQLAPDLESRFVSQGVILPPQDEQAVVEHCIDVFLKG